MNFIFSEVWWMNTIIAAIITGMFTLICSYIAYSYKIRKGLDRKGMFDSEDSDW